MYSVRRYSRIARVANPQGAGRKTLGLQFRDSGGESSGGHTMRVSCVIATKISSEPRPSVFLGEVNGHEKRGLGVPGFRVALSRL